MGVSVEYVSFFQVNDVMLLYMCGYLLRDLCTNPVSFIITCV